MIPRMKVSERSWTPITPTTRHHGRADDGRSDMGKTRLGKDLARASKANSAMCDDCGDIVNWLNGYDMERLANGGCFYCDRCSTEHIDEIEAELVARGDMAWEETCAYAAELEDE